MCRFLKKSLYFHLLSALKHQVFSVTVFRLLPSLMCFLFIDLYNIKYPVNENFILIQDS